MEQVNICIESCVHNYSFDRKSSHLRQESSEDEYEEDAMTAKKLGMVSDKKPVLEEKKLSGIQVNAFLAEMLRIHSHISALLAIRPLNFGGTRKFL